MPESESFDFFPFRGDESILSLQNVTNADISVQIVDEYIADRTTDQDSDDAPTTAQLDASRDLLDTTASTVVEASSSSSYNESLLNVRPKGKNSSVLDYMATE